MMHDFDFERTIRDSVKRRNSPLGRRDELPLLDHGAEVNTSKGRRGFDVIMVILVLSAFTPYLGVGLNIRYEHIIIYGAVVMLALALLKGRRLQLPAFATVLISCWIIFGALTFVNNWGRLQYGLNSVDPLATLDAFLMPLATFLVSFAVARAFPGNPERLIRLVAYTVIACLSVNSLFIAVFEPAGVTDFLRFFWSNPSSEGVAVAEQALLGGRYGGIFNQPFDGGLAYTIGFILWLYLLRSTRHKSLVGWVLLLVSLAFLMSGGFSTQSKVFIYGGLASLLVAALVRFGSKTSRLGSGTLLAFLGAAGLVLAGALGLVTDFERSLNVILQIQEDSTNPYSGLVGVTGGRSDSIDGYVGRVAESLSFLGSGWSGAQDDAYISSLDGGGFLGFLCFLTVLFILFFIAASQQYGSGERFLGLALAILAFGASFGALALQANRGSTLLWILFGLLAVTAETKHRLKSSRTWQTQWPKGRSGARPITRKGRRSSSPSIESG